MPVFSCIPGPTSREAVSLLRAGCEALALPGRSIARELAVELAEALAPSETCTSLDLSGAGHSR